MTGIEATFTDVVDWLYGLPPFLQSLFAAASFWFISYIGRKAWNGTKTALSKIGQKLYLQRYFIHKYYIKSDERQRRIDGIIIILLRSLTFLTISIMAFIFTFGVISILRQDWIWVACAWVALNSSFEAFRWCYMRSEENVLESIDDDIFENFLEDLSISEAELLREERAESNEDLS